MHDVGALLTESRVYALPNRTKCMCFFALLSMNETEEGIESSRRSTPPTCLVQIEIEPGTPKAGRRLLSEDMSPTIAGKLAELFTPPEGALSAGRNVAQQNYGKWL